MLLEEMEDRVEKLKTEFPSDWSPMKTEIEEGRVDMKGKYEETMAFGKPAMKVVRSSAKFPANPV